MRGYNRATKFVYIYIYSKLSLQFCCFLFLLFVVQRSSRVGKKLSYFHSFSRHDSGFFFACTPRFGHLSVFGDVSFVFLLFDFVIFSFEAGLDGNASITPKQGSAYLELWIFNSEYNHNIVICFEKITNFIWNLELSSI